MKTILTVILFSITLTCCKNEITSEHQKVQKIKTKEPTNFNLEVQFLPAFSNPVKLKLVKEIDSGYLECTVNELHFTRYTVSTSRKIKSISKINLSKTDFERFFKILDTTSLLELRDDSIYGRDGISIIVDILQDSLKNKAQIWSPERENATNFYNLLDALFDLANRKLIFQEKHIEDIQIYLSYSPWMKVKCTAPLIIKMFGSYSVDDTCTLRTFFDLLPKNQRVIIDMTNFHGMGTVLDFYFHDSEDLREKLIWVTGNNKQKEYLLRIGCTEDKMVQDIKTAIERVGI